MKLSQLTQVAKDAIDKRGGVDAIKQDLQEARNAASGHDNLMDKARAAAGAFKQPGHDRGRAATTDAPAARPSSEAGPTATPGQERPDPAPAAGQDPPRAA
jgi:hypothetical protein